MTDNQKIDLKCTALFDQNKQWFKDNMVSLIRISMHGPTFFEDNAFVKKMATFLAYYVQVGDGEGGKP